MAVGERAAATGTGASGSGGPSAPVRLQPNGCAGGGCEPLYAERVLRGLGGPSRRLLPLGSPVADVVEQRKLFLALENDLPSFFRGSGPTL